VSHLYRHILGGTVFLSNLMPVPSCHWSCPKENFTGSVFLLSQFEAGEVIFFPLVKSSNELNVAFGWYDLPLNGLPSFRCWFRKVCCDKIKIIVCSYAMIHV